MNNYMGRRKYKRVELEKWKYNEIVSPCIARFRVTQSDDQKTTSLEWNIVAVKNLSAGGVMFNYYKTDLGFGSLLELELDFIKSRPNISCMGRVVRIEDAHANSMFRIATEFTEINDLDREIISTTVESILNREAKKRVYSEKQKKIKDALTKRLEIKEVMLEGSKIITTPSVYLYDEIRTRIRTAPKTLPLGETKRIPESVFSTLRKSDMAGRKKTAKNIHESKTVDGKSTKSKTQEADPGKPGTITQVNRKAILGREVFDCHAKSRESKQKESLATAFVIAYMVSMLILGFIAHSALIKQFNRVETWLDNVVSKVVYSGF